jgi:hypothetical protein
MFDRLTSCAALLLVAAGCGADDASGRGTWDVVAEPLACSSTDTGAATNDDPGIPRVLELQGDGVALVTLDDGVIVHGSWTAIDGDPRLPLNAPGRQPQLDFTVPDYEHAGASWMNLGLRLSTEDGNPSVARGVWQAIATHPTTVTHSICATGLVVTQR